MRALVDDILLDSRQPVEDDGTSSTLDIEDGLAGEDGTTGGNGRRSVDELERSRYGRHGDFVLVEGSCLLQSR
jgi:hypothetical protein